MGCQWVTVAPAVSMCYVVGCRGVRFGRLLFGLGECLGWLSRGSVGDRYTTVACMVGEIEKGGEGHWPLHRQTLCVQSLAVIVSVSAAFYAAWVSALDD